LDISCVARSLCCHVSIRCVAVFKYDSEGSGVLKDSSGGSAGKSVGGICGLLAQAVRDSAQLVKITAQQRLAGSGSIQRLLVVGVDGLLCATHSGVGRALGCADSQRFTHRARTRACATKDEAVRLTTLKDCRCIFGVLVVWMRGT
jgi:hypothetical protein